MRHLGAFQLRFLHKSSSLSQRNPSTTAFILPPNPAAAPGGHASALPALCRCDDVLSVEPSSSQPSALAPTTRWLFPMSLVSINAELVKDASLWRPVVM